VPGALLALDGGDPRPLPLDKPVRVVEGQHKAVVTAPEHLDLTTDFKVEGGKAAEVALEPLPKPKPKPPPPPPPPPPPKPERRELVPHQRLVGMATAGAGVAFGVGALVTILESAHWHSQANADATLHLKEYGSGCAKGDPRLCAFDITVTNQESDLANHLRNTAAGLGITAAVLAAGGVVLVATAPRAHPHPLDSALSRWGRERPQTPGSFGAPPVAPPPQASVSCGAGAGSLFCNGTF
jgi:hypothetical protein